MNYQKVDALLATVLDDAKDKEESKETFTIFIHTVHVPEAAEARFLRELGVKEDIDERQVFTASLSPCDISELSEQSWIRQLRLAQPMRLQPW